MGACAMFLFASMTLVADQPVEMPAFEITALQRRQAIKSGHVEISLETFLKTKKKGDVNRSSLLALRGMETNQLHLNRLADCTFREPCVWYCHSQWDIQLPSICKLGPCSRQSSEYDQLTSRQCFATTCSPVSCRGKSASALSERSLLARLMARRRRFNCWLVMYFNPGFDLAFQESLLLKRTSPDSASRSS